MFTVADCICIQISYADVLLEFPFKGDEAALRGMEHAELISITTQDGTLCSDLSMEQTTQKDTFKGLPVSIKPGKPVYLTVFQRLVSGASAHPSSYVCRH